MPDRTTIEIRQIMLLDLQNLPKSTDSGPGFPATPRDVQRALTNVGKVLERTLLETVVVNEGGRRKTMTKLQATVKQITNKAASGDLRAAKFLAQPGPHRRTTS